MGESKEQGSNRAFLGEFIRIRSNVTALSPACLSEAIDFPLFNTIYIRIYHFKGKKEKKDLHKPPRLSLFTCICRTTDKKRGATWGGPLRRSTMHENSFYHAETRMTDCLVPNISLCRVGHSRRERKIKRQNTPYLRATSQYYDVRLSEQNDMELPGIHPPPFFCRSPSVATTKWGRSFVGDGRGFALHPAIFFFRRVERPKIGSSEARYTESKKTRP